MEKRAIDALAAEKVAGWKWNVAPSTFNPKVIIKNLCAPDKFIYGVWITGDEAPTYFVDLPRYTESMDAAMMLSKPNWMWTSEDLWDGVLVVLERVNIGGEELAELANCFIYWSDHPNKLVARAYGHTIAALKACGVDVDKVTQKLVLTAQGQAVE